MRRIVMALFGTLIGTALLVGLKTEKLVTPLGISAPTPADPAAAGSDGSAGGTVQPEQSGQPSQSGQAAVPSTSPGPGKAAPATATDQARDGGEADHGSDHRRAAGEPYDHRKCSRYRLAR